MIKPSDSIRQLISEYKVNKKELEENVQKRTQWILQQACVEFFNKNFEFVTSFGFMYANGNIYTSPEEIYLNGKCLEDIEKEEFSDEYKSVFKFKAKKISDFLKKIPTEFFPYMFSDRVKVTIDHSDIHIEELSR